MDFGHKSLIQLKEMSTSALKGAEREVWILLHLYFDVKVENKEAMEASKTLKCIIRLKELAIKASRRELRGGRGPGVGW